MAEIAPGSVARLNAEDIIKTSEAETGLQDIGEPGIREGLERLLAAFVSEAHFNAAGIEAQRANLVRIYSNRLRVQDLLTRHPEILEEKIIGPIFIVGLPRSGTTKLQRLIAASPDLQKLPLWKVMHPVPLDMDNPERDGRLKAAEQLSQTMREQFPDFFAGHPMIATEPEEEEWMLDMVMLGYINSHSSRTPSFAEWMQKQDFSPWYIYLRKLVQVFQWLDGSPHKPWLLKAPSHLEHMRLLCNYFPDATIVHCHRDPVNTTASFSRVVEASRGMYSDNVDKEEGARFVLSHWSRLMRIYMEQRSLLEKEHSFVDIAYSEIVGDTMPAVKRVYEAANIEFSREALHAMQNWINSNPQNKHGRNRYELEDYGLTRSEVEEAYSAYLERFGDLI